MRILRYKSLEGAPSYGVLKDDVIYSLNGSITSDFSIGELICDLKNFELLAPCEPTKIICAAVNFPGTSHF